MTRRATVLIAIIPPAITDPIEYVDEEPTLEFYQQKVGGYIESLTMPPHLCMYVDEEHKLKDEPEPNIRATVIARSFGRIHGRDWIGGTAVLVGAVDAEGDDTPLPEEMKDQLANLQKQLAASVN
jgi:hypothetical protein